MKCDDGSDKFGSMCENVLFPGLRYSPEFCILGMRNL